MRRCDTKKLYYTCFYCNTSENPLIQLGAECRMEGDSYIISPEDDNAVEICEACLRKALKLFEREEEDR